MKQLFLLSFLLWPALANATGMHTPGNLHSLTLDELEWQGKNISHLFVHGWSGDAFNKLSYELELDHTQHGDTAREVDLTYQFAVTPFSDLKVGLSHLVNESVNDTFITFGALGTTTGFIHFDSKLLLGPAGKVGLSLEFEHEYPLSKHWVMESSITVEALSGIEDSGLQETTLGLRFNYETLNRLGFYVGAEWTDEHQVSSDDLRGVIGLSYWY